jgi:hypothetical protein
MRKLLFYATSSVHLRNLELIASHLSGWSFLVIYEPWINDVGLDQCNFEKLKFVADNIPQKLSPEGIDGVIFSTVQPRRAPLNLLRWSLEHRIPTIAIEETNQLALNNGRINNYLLPVDQVLLASRAEMRFFKREAIPPQRLRVTGWPFYAGAARKTEEQKRIYRKRLGLYAQCSVAALTLSGINFAGETASVRRRQLKMAAGLPENYQLVIKPHPSEPVEILREFARQYAPRAVLVDAAVPIGELLGATDVLLNRGVSQVAIEALLCGIPVIVLETGVTTPFHTAVPEFVAGDAAQVHAAVLRLEGQSDPLALYQGFLNEHIPFPPQQARSLTSEAIVEVLRNGRITCDPTEQWIDWSLYAAWGLDRRTAIAVLQSDRVKGRERTVEALSRLIQRKATRVDLQFLEGELAGNFRKYVLRSLWIDSIERMSKPLEDDDLAVMHDFPSTLNISYFCAHCEKWMKILLSAGRREEAREFALRLEVIYGDDPLIAPALKTRRLHQGGLVGRSEYALYSLTRTLYFTLRDGRHKLRRVQVAWDRMVG